MTQQLDMARQQALLDANPRQFLNIPAVQVGDSEQLTVLDAARHLLVGPELRLLGRSLGATGSAVTLTTEQLQQGLLVTGSCTDSDLLCTSLMAQQLAQGCGFLSLGHRAHSDRAYLLQAVMQQTQSNADLCWISPDAGRGYAYVSSLYRPLKAPTAEPGMLDILQLAQRDYSFPPEVSLLASIQAGRGLLVEVPTMGKATTEKRFVDLVVNDLALTVSQLEESGFKAAVPFLVLVDLPVGLGFEDVVPLLERLKALGLAVVLVVNWPGMLQRDRPSLAADLAERLPHALHTQRPVNDAPAQGAWQAASAGLGPWQARLVSAGDQRQLNLVGLQLR